MAKKKPKNLKQSTIIKNQMVLFMDWIIHVLEAQMRMYGLPGKEDYCL